MLPNMSWNPERQPASNQPADAQQTAVERAVRLAGNAHLTGPPPALSPSLSAAGSDEARMLRLTPRQYQILLLLAKGHQLKVISRMLDISLATVKSHAGQLYHRLGARNAIEAVYAARQRGANLHLPALEEPGIDS
ncbi:response regulator transcription factor [Cupriavidus sp. TMH.W2]|uniref:response regulator transcription factor n=1 Tax=Cupriavidus sp. TMH.W2 TaxID=3434465 RepID=UPI003D784E0B